MQAKESNRVNEVVKTALGNLEELIDVNTIVGEPVVTKEGDCIIPVSQVTLVVLAGGGEYGKTSVFVKGKDLPFSAGNGTIVSVKPSGFLIKDRECGYKLLSSEPTYEKIIDKVSDYISNLSKNDNE